MKGRQAHDVTPGSGDAIQESAQRQTILLVDDEEIVRNVVQRLLEPFGYRVLAASCADEAEAIFETHVREVSLLLTDVHMPGSSGPDLYHRLTEKRPDLPVVYMSGSPDAAQAMVGEGRTLLVKPFAAEELLKAVREAPNGGA